MAERTVRGGSRLPSPSFPQRRDLDVPTSIRSRPPDARALRIPAARGERRGGASPSIAGPGGGANPSPPLGAGWAAVKGVGHVEIPAFAGTTEKGAGMTDEGGMAGRAVKGVR